MDGTPMLGIVVGEQERAKVDPVVNTTPREGPTRMLVAAFPGEEDEFRLTHTSERDETGKAVVARNRAAQVHRVKTAAGQLNFRDLRVNDRRAGKSFIGPILPPWALRSPKAPEMLR